MELRICRLPQVFLLACFQSAPLHTQSDKWDSILSNSNWHVPAENLLAYLTSTTDLTAIKPAADQTLWNIGTATIEELRSATLPALQRYWDEPARVLRLIGREWIRSQANASH